LQFNIPRIKALGVIIVNISPDTPEYARKMNQYEFVNISDPNREIIKLYDALTVKPLESDALFKLKDLPIPITFLISGNGEGKVVWKYIGTKEIRPTPDEIIQAVYRHVI
jgi:peroxiredoxin